MKKIIPLRKYSFAIYGLGISGKSVINYLKNKKVNEIFTWDDELFKNDKKKLSIFKSSLSKVDYIIISPGISINKSIFKKHLFKNRNKIITDLDLFYLENNSIKTIVITGTNGKSTTCKLLEHLFKTNKDDVQLGGNIGKPILNLRIKKKTIVIIEASSFQLAYSKFLRPNYAAILNITKDHLDWHLNMRHYIKSKFKIFSRQSKTDYALLKEEKLIRIFKKNNFKSKLLKVHNNILDNKIKKQINNFYLLSKPNIENLIFVLKFAKIFKIKNSIFLSAINSFKGLPHRHELFYKKKRISIINDSKATSFEACKYSLKKNKNIFWIVGGLPKLGDRFKLKYLKKNILKAYIIGKNTTFFTKQLSKEINYKISHNLKNAVIDIIKDLKKFKNKSLTILLSPASASYDQFNNFVDRGNQFKKMINLNAKKFI